ncbi:MAG: hypothetical protein MZV63_60150 [Marinilabiliales bacterium]|nr:hypothetical protein [Marinilabiliales bacterium]
MMKATGGQGADILIETASSPKVWDYLLDLMAAHGRMSVFGLYPQAQTSAPGADPQGRDPLRGRGVPVPALHARHRLAVVGQGVGQGPGDEAVHPRPGRRGLRGVQEQGNREMPVRGVSARCAWRPSARA